MKFGLFWPFLANSIYYVDLAHLKMILTDFWALTDFWTLFLDTE